MITGLGRYRILDTIGQGGMGTVYRAVDSVLDRQVALKVVASDAELNAELTARLLREAKACAQLSHQNVVSIYDFGEDAGRFFIVMELLDGQDLKRLIAEHTSLSVVEKLDVMIQVCDGLDYAHQLGIVHRDVKPANIFVLRNRRVKILDFGLALLTTGDTSLTRTGQILGTLAYMAPERFRGISDRRGDVFAVGAVSYELFTGRRAFVADTAIQLIEMIRTAQPAPLTSIDPGLPRELAVTVDSALQKDPATRCSDLGAMREAFDQVRQRLMSSGEIVRAAGGTAPASSAPPPAKAGVSDTLSVARSSASGSRPRTATLVGRFATKFRRFRLVISISFTVTAVIALYLVNLTRNADTSLPLPQEILLKPPTSSAPTPMRPDVAERVATLPELAPPPAAAPSATPAPVTQFPPVPPSVAQHQVTPPADPAAMEGKESKAVAAHEPHVGPLAVLAVLESLRSAVAAARDEASKAGAEKLARAQFADAIAMETSATAALHQGDTATAEQRYQDALAAFRQAQAGATTFAKQAGEAQSAERLAVAAKEAAESAQAAQRAPGSWSRAILAHGRGTEALATGAFDQAIAFFNNARQGYLEAASAAGMVASGTEELRPSSPEPQAPSRQPSAPTLSQVSDSLERVEGPPPSAPSGGSTVATKPSTTRPRPTSAQPSPFESRPGLMRTFDAPIETVHAASEKALVSLGWEVDKDKTRRSEGLIVIEARRLDSQDFGVYAEGLRHRLYVTVKGESGGKTSVSVRREIYKEKRVLWHTERTIIPPQDTNVETAILDAIRQQL